MNATNEPVDSAVAALLEPFLEDGPDTVEVRMLAPDAIEANPDQPRRMFSEEGHEALVASVRRHGVLQPLVVRASATPGRYELVAGERRLRAARALHLPRIPAVVAEIPDDRLLEVALVENLQRSSLNPIEEADAYRSLIDRYGYTQETVAERVGKSRPSVANALRLLELPAGVKREVAEGRLSAGHARALCGLTSGEAQSTLAEMVLRRGLSVRETETEVARLKRGRAPTKGPAKPEPTERPAYLGQLEDRLRRVLGTRVKLVQSGRARGKIVIDFHSDDEFERLLEFFS